MSLELDVELFFQLMHEAYKMLTVAVETVSGSCDIVGVLCTQKNSIVSLGHISILKGLHYLLGSWFPE